MTGFKLKVILRGNQNFRRRSIIERVIESRFEKNYKLTVGVDILTKNVEYMQGETATLCIWDIADQHRFDFYRPLFYKGASGAIINFDLSKKGMYQEAIRWLIDITNYIGFIPFILIGNNSQLIKKKDEKEIREKAFEFAKDEGGIYIETSPKSVNILNKALCELIRRIIQIQIIN
ncbi:MAG: Rab family GTPase [Candidatus Odinarchaeota archaeon]